MGMDTLLMEEVHSTGFVISNMIKISFSKIHLQDGQGGNGGVTKPAPMMK